MSSSDNKLTVEVQIQRLYGYVNSAAHGDQLTENACCVEHAYLREPSLNLLPQFHGITLPSLSFCIRTTGFKIPGTAAEASNALQIIVSGAVI